MIHPCLHKADHPELIFNVVPIAKERSTKQLGVHLDDLLSFSNHIHKVLIKAKEESLKMYF